MLSHDNIGIDARTISLLFDKVLLIGLGHKARNGKHFFARAIQRHIAGPSGVYAFGDALKAYCRVSYGMGKKDPAMLVQVGDKFRKIDKHIFVDALRGTLHEASEEIGPHVALIADVRYQEEVDFIRSHGLLLKITLMDNGIPVITNDGRASHISENALNEYTQWDYNFVFDKNNPLDFAHAAIIIARQASRIMLERSLFHKV